jgi:hypothetical protein
MDTSITSPRRQIADEEHQENALIKECLRQLYGQDNRELDELEKTIRQLEAEGKIRPASELSE